VSLAEGQQIELTIEKPAAGGWMIARHLGQVVLVRGTLPGERVLAWVEKAEKRLAYALTREVLDASPDRRPTDGDPLCGGALYSHIAYPRQLAIKSDVIRDAFARLGRHPIERPIDVLGSPEEHYRMRARFHVRAGRAGFYREGTHQLCDAAPTKQLRPETCASVDALCAALEREAPGSVMTIAIAENIAADERAAHLEVSSSARVTQAVLDRAAAASDLRGISVRDMTNGHLLSAGTPDVNESLATVTGGRAGRGTLRRRAESFFQGNRFLLPALVTAVADLVADAGSVVDLYAGAGLFAVSLAAMGRLRLTAVEGDRSSGEDLLENARHYGVGLEAAVTSVETFLASRRGDPPEAVVLDPPRTGVSSEALAALARIGAGRLVYVSCDPPTLARDARRLLDAGYRLDSLRAFDFFPNTPHVESLAAFVKT
jgi:23S rRNA (uracil1939-C5)-methyltransferase